MLNDKFFLNNLFKISGIKELFATTKGNTLLANYHEMYESGFLGTHVDHSSEPETGFPHVLNIILYLSKKSFPMPITCDPCPGKITENILKKPFFYYFCYCN